MEDQERDKEERQEGREEVEEGEVVQEESGEDEEEAEKQESGLQEGRGVEEGEHTSPATTDPAIEGLLSHLEEGEVPTTTTSTEDEGEQPHPPPRDTDTAAGVSSPTTTTTTTTPRRRHNSAAAPPPSSSPRKGSFVWEHFQLPQGANIVTCPEASVVTCTICGCKVSRGSGCKSVGTTALHKHLHYHHPEVYASHSQDFRRVTRKKGPRASTSTSTSHKGPRASTSRTPAPSAAANTTAAGAPIATTTTPSGAVAQAGATTTPHSKKRLRKTHHLTPPAAAPSSPPDPQLTVGSDVTLPSVPADDATLWGQAGVICRRCAKVVSLGELTDEGRTASLRQHFIKCHFQHL